MYINMSKDSMNVDKRCTCSSLVTSYEHFYMQWMIFSHYIKPLCSKTPRLYSICLHIFAVRQVMKVYMSIWAMTYSETMPHTEWLPFDIKCHCSGIYHLVPCYLLGLWHWSISWPMYHISLWWQQRRYWHHQQWLW